MALYAVKANKVYQVDEATKEEYLAKGYDIVDENGKAVEKSPSATVPYAEYAKVVDEVKALKAEIETLKASEPAEKKGKEK